MSERLLLAEARDVGVSFHGRRVLDKVNLAVHAGEIVTLIGPNGAGKSTLVRVMLGLQRPQRGQVFRQERIAIGYVPQRLSVDPTLPLDVRRFLTLGRPNKEARIRQVLDEVGAGGLLRSAMQTLSGGELQRVLLARALLREPALLFLDEPVQGVDVSGQNELYDLIGRLREQRGCGILMVSHDLHLVMAHTDRVFCLDQQMCCTGHPAQIQDQAAFKKLFGADAPLLPYAHHHKQAENGGWCGQCDRHHGAGEGHG